MESKEFKTEQGLRKDSVLNLLLFILIMEEVRRTREISLWQETLSINVDKGQIMRASKKGIHTNTYRWTHIESLLNIIERNQLKYFGYENRLKEVREVKKLLEARKIPKGRTKETWDQMLILLCFLLFQRIVSDSNSYYLFIAFFVRLPNS